MLMEALASYSVKVEEALKEFLDREVARGGKVGGFHEEYYLNLKEYLLRGGKRLRPVSLIMAYRGVGGKDEEAIVKASICVELLHNSSLVHDDIIDRDELRRGGPTFHAKYREWFSRRGASGDPQHFGVSLGILGGDSLFNMGFKSLVNSGFREDLVVKSLKLYVEAYEQLIDGMLLDMYLPIAGRASEEDYLEMVRLKTAALFEKSLLIGATLGEASQSQLKALSEYAVLSAQGFQIQDDIIGLFGEEEEIGKPVGSDIREGKMTLLVIKALEEADPKHRERLRVMLGKSDLSREEVEEARRIIEETGALSYAQRKALELIERAKERLREATPKLTAEAVEFFDELSDFFIKRRF
ncbi:MAG: hypothetical protein DRJ97_03600 [Thermoprotei archaeon]|nr:MAG: hypothetical protein DRJ97_03600 [Thermoprotei archaeon]